MLAYMCIFTYLHACYTHTHTLRAHRAAEKRIRDAVAAGAERGLSNPEAHLAVSSVPPPKGSSSSGAARQAGAGRGSTAGGKAAGGGKAAKAGGQKGGQMQGQVSGPDAQTSNSVEGLCVCVCVCMECMWHLGAYVYVCAGNSVAFKIWDLCVCLGLYTGD